MVSVESPLCWPPIARSDHRRNEKLGENRRRKLIQKNLPPVSLHRIFLEPSIASKTGIFDENLDCPIQRVHLAKQVLGSVGSREIDSDHLGFDFKALANIPSDLVQGRSERDARMRFARRKASSYAKVLPIPEDTRLLTPIPFVVETFSLHHTPIS